LLIDKKYKPTGLLFESLPGQVPLHGLCFRLALARILAPKELYQLNFRMRFLNQ